MSKRFRESDPRMRGIACAPAQPATCAFIRAFFAQPAKQQAALLLIAWSTARRASRNPARPRRRREVLVFIRADEIEHPVRIVPACPTGSAPTCRPAERSGAFPSRCLSSDTARQQRVQVFPLDQISGRYRKAAPPTPAIRDASTMYHVSPSRHTNGSRKSWVLPASAGISLSTGLPRTFPTSAARRNSLPALGLAPIASPRTPVYISVGTPLLSTAQPEKQPARPGCPAWAPVPSAICPVDQILAANVPPVDYAHRRPLAGLCW